MEAAKPVPLQRKRQGDERRELPAPETTATPTKEVEFEYDYGEGDGDWPGGIPTAELAPTLVGFVGEPRGGRSILMFAALFGRPTRYGKGSGDVSFWAEYPLSSQAAAASEANLNALLTRPNSARLLEEFPTEVAIHSMDPPPALKATGAVMEFTADNMDSRMLAEAVTVLLEEFSGCAEILVRTAEMVMVTFTNLEVASHFVE